MKVLGITGGVGAGKSTILEYLTRAYGARVIQADQVGHHADGCPDRRCYEPVVRNFLGSWNASMSDRFSLTGKRMGQTGVCGERYAGKAQYGIIHPAVKKLISCRGD